MGNFVLPPNVFKVKKSNHRNFFMHLSDYFSKIISFGFLYVQINVYTKSTCNALTILTAPSVSHKRVISHFVLYLMKRTHKPFYFLKAHYVGYLIPTSLRLDQLDHPDHPDCPIHPINLTHPYHPGHPIKSA